MSLYLNSQQVTYSKLFKSNKAFTSKRTILSDRTDEHLAEKAAI